MSEQLNHLIGLNNDTRLQSGGIVTAETNISSWTTTMERGISIYGISDGITVDKLLYGSTGGSMFFFECSMNSVLLEANMVYESDTCEAKRLRRFRTSRAERNATDLPYDVVHDSYTFKDFITYLADIGGLASKRQNEPRR
jgi:hypothetical protein